MTIGEITVSGVSKRFRLERNRPSSLKEAILRLGRNKDVDDFWVLRDHLIEINASTEELPTQVRLQLTSNWWWQLEAPAYVSGGNPLIAPLPEGALHVLGPM